MNKKQNPGKAERYVQPSLLVALLEGPSYGYELLQRIGESGFLQGDPPPGMIYRHLRQMEEEGLVTSQWKVEDAGPAKRMYEISPDGVEMLDVWTRYMAKQAELLTRFVHRCRARMDERGGAVKKEMS